MSWADFFSACGGEGLQRNEPWRHKANGPWPAKDLQRSVEARPLLELHVDVTYELLGGCVPRWPLPQGATGKMVGVGCVALMGVVEDSMEILALEGFWPLGGIIGWLSGCRQCSCIKGDDQCGERTEEPAATSYALTGCPGGDSMLTASRFPSRAVARHAQANNQCSE